jgi:EmrB/QacA subfamily drug resistance transporter
MLHMASSPTATATGAHQQAYDRRWWTLGVLCLSLLIVFTGNSSLNVALPSLSRDLGATESQLQWVVASYSLVFAGLLFTTGALGDRFGRKGALQLGLATFFVAAAFASQATDTWQIIGCRAVMGLGAALIMPSTLSILVNVFPAGERAKAIAIWAATTGVAGAFGPLASGFLLTHFWFGSVFLINLPVIAVAFVGGWFLVPKSKDPDEARLDPVGALLSIVGISSLVFGLIQAPDKGWGSVQTLGAFAVAAVVLTAFVLWELHVDEPMLDMRFFRNPSFSTGSGGMLLVFLAMFGVMFLMTQYFQLVLGYSPLSAAVRLLPMAPIMIIVAPLTPRLSARFGANRVVGFGMVLIAVGFAVFSRVGLDTPYWWILLALIPLVSGMAMAMSPMTAAIMSAVPSRRAGAGSAMNDATRELGAALGVAVLGSIAASQYSSHLHDALEALPAAARASAGSSIAGALHAAAQLPGPAGRLFELTARTAFVDGIHVAALFGVGLAIIAAVLTTRYLPRHLTDGALHSPVDALEDVAELGLGGAPPLFDDHESPNIDEPVGATSSARTHRVGSQTLP